MQKVAKVLIIDDDPDIRKSMGLRLRSKNYETTFAADAMAAVKVARSEIPDVILLDLGLPGGDGFLALERIRAFPDLSQIPIVVVSAKEFTGIRSQLFNARVDGYLPKPVDSTSLFSTLDRLLA